MIDVTPHVSYVFSAPPHLSIRRKLFSVFNETNTLGIPTPFSFQIHLIAYVGDYLEPRQQAGLGCRPLVLMEWAGLLQKPNVMCRGEVRPEDREDESVENGKCFHGGISTPPPLPLPSQFRSFVTYETIHEQNLIFLLQRKKSRTQILAANYLARASKPKMPTSRSTPAICSSILTKQTPFASKPLLPPAINTKMRKSTEIFA